MTRYFSDKNNPKKAPRVKAKAAALKYDGINAPKVIAKGEGDAAEEIIKIAQQNEVHIHYDPLLLEVLSRLELNQEIPETLYQAVAKIIAFAYYLQGKCPKGFDLSTSKDTFAKQSNLVESREHVYLDGSNTTSAGSTLRALPAPTKSLDNQKEVLYYQTQQDTDSEM
ncbi:MAG: EscU/YscU/HrcU family type III secretion system export apparatus switch protein [Enterobacterales bacterium]|nr:EscU/YscU/HrcU family type III secretion system export apparatus switch protein [Enterobacterales bacterium]